MSYLQEIADNTQEKGKYILTGSENFVLSESITQSLSGRIGMTTLLPLSMSEIKEERIFTPLEHIFYGGYPGLYQNNMTTNDFYLSYIQTYIEHDVRQFKNIENLHTFQNFLKLCAGRIGQLVNLSSLAQDCGISQPTARAWLSILESSYIVFFLSPFYKNFSKRVIKMPKLYFYDTGLACSLLSLEKTEQIETHYLKGALYENLIILELLKGRLNRGLLPSLYFWRDHTGHEIDCIAEWGGQMHAIEIKMNQTFSPDQLAGINFIKSIAPEINGYLIYNGKEEGKIQNITLLSMENLEKIFNG